MKEHPLGHNALKRCVDEERDKLDREGGPHERGSELYVQELKARVDERDDAAIIGYLSSEKAQRRRDWGLKHWSFRYEEETKGGSQETGDHVEEKHKADTKSKAKASEWERRAARRLFQ